MVGVINANGNGILNVRGDPASERRESKQPVPPGLPEVLQPIQRDDRFAGASYFVDR